MSQLGGQGGSNTAQEGHFGPWSLLLRHLGTWFAKVGDESTRQATSRVLKEVGCAGMFAKWHPIQVAHPHCPTPPLPALQLAIFYVLIVIGFLLLYLTWKSNAK